MTTVARTVMTAETMSERDAFRFWSRVVPSDASGCWEWVGFRNDSGYGALGWGRGTRVSAHRAAYTICVGDIPPGLFVLHSCDNPPCVNPAHLSVGTNEENVRQMMERGRNPSRRGENNGRARLTPEQVAEIRAHAERGARYTKAALARMFGVGRVTVHDIIYGKTWSSGT